MGIVGLRIETASGLVVHLRPAGSEVFALWVEHGDRCDRSSAEIHAGTLSTLTGGALEDLMRWIAVPVVDSRRPGALERAS